MLVSFGISSGMRPVINIPFEFSRNVRIDCCGSKRCMAKEELDCFEVHSVFEPMRRNGMADGMWGDPLRQAACLQVGGKIPVDRTGCEALSPSI